jgi:oligopeptide/dipeptide ABC transporter ATP-binding protein
MFRREARHAASTNGEEVRLDPTQPLLQISDLVVVYEARHRSRQGGRRRVVALDGVSIDIQAGESVAIVGESGSGKSTLARAVVGLVPPTSGQIRYEGIDLTTVSSQKLRTLRREIQMVFQDPYGSVNPRWTVRAVVSEPLQNFHSDWSRSQRNEYVTEMLSRVRLPLDTIDRSVTAMSGGQLQRVGIARALALGPRILVADEPVSALDVSIQARILTLLADLKQSERISLLFITHNLAVAQFIADRIAVVYAGRVMEVGAADDVIESPEHPYTKELLAAIPGVREKRSSTEEQQGAVAAHQSGCPFQNRCPDVTDICRSVTPPLEPKRSGRMVACHLVDRPRSDIVPIAQIATNGSQAAGTVGVATHDQRPPDAPFGPESGNAFDDDV